MSWYFMRIFDLHEMQRLIIYEKKKKKNRKSIPKNFA